MKTPSQNKSTGKAVAYADLEEKPVPQLNEPLVSYVRLDPALHGRIISEELTPEEEAMADDPNVKPFAHVGDSAAYVRRIRRDFRG